MRYLITIQYDGSHFYGFQRLRDKPTVQKSIEDVLTKINSTPVLLKGAGRTDVGVHAMGQRAHFNLDVPIPVEGLKKRLNQSLKPYIQISNCEIVSDDFHARFSVKEKTYTYKIYLGEFHPLLHDYYWEVSNLLDYKQMKKASKLFLGAHDFRNFVSGERDCYDAALSQIKFKKKKNVLEITFIGKSFYRYMVRNLVGSLYDAGIHKCNLDDIANALNNPLISKQFTTAPSNGLYLMKINY